MDYVKVELQDIILNGYGKGSVLFVKKEVAEPLIKKGFATVANTDSEVKIVVTADNGKTPVFIKHGNTIKLAR